MQFLEQNIRTKHSATNNKYSEETISLNNKQLWQNEKTKKWSFLHQKTTNNNN